LSNSSAPATATRGDRIAVAAAAAAAFTVYLLTMARTVSFWDSGEYIACSWIAGVPHPPCVPLFTLLGRVSTVIFGFLPDIATRVNLMCVICGTFSVALLARLVQRWMARMDLEPSFYRPVSIAAALMSAFSFTIWQNNNAAETYAVSQFFAVLSLWVFDIWIVRNGEGRAGDRLLLLVLYLLTLAVAVHLAALIVIPGMLVVYTRRASTGMTRLWRDSRTIFMVLGLMAVAFSAHLYMPVRAIARPEINETDPSRWTAFRDALGRKQYGSMSFLTRKGPIDQQLLQYAQYLSWQTGRPESWQRALGGAGEPMSVFFRFLLSAAAIWGAIMMSRRKKEVLYLAGTIFLVSSLFFILYLNFKTGPAGTATGEVRDRDYFYADSFSFFAVFSVLGAGFVLRSLARKPGAAWALLALPAIAVGMNYYECDRSRDFAAHDYGINLLESCPQGAILITNGDNDTFPLWFAQSVLEVRRDVIVSNLSLMNTNWYIHQLLDRDSTLLGYDEAGLVDSLRPVFVWGPHFFHVLENGYPLANATDDALLRTAFDQAWPWAFRLDSLAVAVPVKGRGLQGSLAMQDLVLLDMVGRRPIHGREVYLAGTVATDNRVYLDDYLVMEGIAFRVAGAPCVGAADRDKGIALMDGYCYSGLDDAGIYKDDQTVQIVRNYVSAYHRIAYGALFDGDPAALSHALDQARGLFSAMPGEWLAILPSHAMLESRLADGLYGPEAAAETLEVRADYLASAAAAAGSSRLQGTASMMREVAADFDRESQFLVFADSLAGESWAGRWIRLEVDLGFGNYIKAWRDMDGWEAGAPGSPEAAMARARMETFFRTTPIDGRYDLTAGGLAVILTLTEGDSLTCGNLLAAMCGLASDGKQLEAAAAATILAGRLADEDETALVLSYADELVSDPGLARQRAGWFLLETARTGSAALAWQCAHLGDAPLCFLALEGTEGSGAALEALLRDPGSFVRSLPRPGTGGGAYSWVATLGRGA